jgi:hypothetical protein
MHVKSMNKARKMAEGFERMKCVEDSEEERVECCHTGGGARR